MPAILANIPPLERRSFSIVGTAGTGLVGSTNTQVVAFNQVSVLMFGQTYNVTNASSTQPAPGSGGWVNVVNDAAFGTTFKFLRRGVYRFEVFLPVVAPEVTPTPYTSALTLDAQAANLLAAGTLAPTTQNVRGERAVFGFTNGVIPITSSPSINFGGTVLISDALADYDTTGTLPLAAAGAQGIGVVRLHLQGDGVIITDVFNNDTVSLWCTHLNDLAG